MGFVENVNKLAQTMPDDVGARLVEIEENINNLEDSIDNLDNAKVDKITGYSLTKNDFTDTLKSKLDGIATNANAYVHPATHPASIIDGSAYPNQFLKTDNAGNTGFDYATWSEIAGKPSSFNPDDHTHSMSEITSGTLSATRIATTSNLTFVSQEEKLSIISAEQTSNKGEANGYCPLDSNGKINASFLNEMQVINVYTADNEAEMLLLSQAGIGDICIRTDEVVAYMLTSLPSSDVDNWFGLSVNIGVTSWNGLTGEVNASTDDLEEGTERLYFTAERVDDRINAFLVAGSNITLTYSDDLNTLTIDSSDDSKEDLNIINMDNVPNIFVGGKRKEWTKGLPSFVGMIAIEITGLYNESNMNGMMNVHILEVSTTKQARIITVSGQWNNSSSQWDYGFGVDYNSIVAMNIRFARDTVNHKVYVLIGDVSSAWNNTRVSIEIPLSSYNTNLNLGFNIGTLNTLTGLNVDVNKPIELKANLVTTVGKDSNTGAAYIPSGTTAERPSSPSIGYMRFNTTIGKAEMWNGTAWSSVSSGAVGSGSDSVFYENDQIVTTNYTITSGKNAMSAGPITVNSGVTVTVPSGSVWTIV